MVPTNYIPYRNENSQRNFPFVDNRELKDDQGRILPQDYFIDGNIFPIDLDDPVYLHSVNTTVVELGAGGNIIATGVLANGIVDLYDSWSRHIGMLVAGEGINTLGTYTFDDDVAQFDPIIVFPQNYTCVRGFVLPDGSVLTGDVIFIGENGLFVISEIIDGRKVIRFDAVGMPVTQECIKLNPALKCIKFHQLPGDTPLRITRDSNTILISTSHEMAEICVNDKLAKGYPYDDTLPLSDDVCDPPPVIPSPPPAPEYTDEFPCPTPEEHQGNYYILPMTTGLGIEEVEYVKAPVFVTDDAGNIIQLDDRTSQGLKISLKGLTVL